MQTHSFTREDAQLFIEWTPALEAEKKAVLTQLEDSCRERVPKSLLVLLDDEPNCMYAPLEQPPTEHPVARSLRNGIACLGCVGMIALVYLPVAVVALVAWWMWHIVKRCQR